MIPDLTLDGTLPPGIHETNWEEFETKFVYNVRRIEIYEGLKKLVVDLKKIGCTSLYIDGSFVTHKILPKDVDVCWEDLNFNDGMYENAFNKVPALFDLGFPRVSQQNIYKADVFPASIYENGSKKLFIDFFQFDKVTGLQKGIIKINII